MCYQVLELYSACRCLYYQHAVDGCPQYGKRGHIIKQRTILVGYACMYHSTPTRALCRDKTPRHPTRDESAETSQKRKREVPKVDQGSQNIPETNPSSQISATGEPTLDAEKESKSGRQENSRSGKEEVQPAGVAGTEPKEHTAPSLLNHSDRHSLDPEDNASIDGSTVSDESSSSGESVTSETETIISIASSTTTVDSDVTEVVFRRLLLFQDLCYLWPQLVLRCGSRRLSVITIERLLRRYSEDLSNLAASTEDLSDSDSLICLTACRFVRRSRLNIANRIWEAHSEGSDDHTEADVERMEDNTMVATRGDSENIDFIYEISERFLFDTEPIKSLQFSVKALVGSQHPEVDGLSFGLFRSAEVYLSNVASFVYDPPIKPGSQRIRWKCMCGQNLYDDYIELQSGAIANLEQLLKQYCSNMDVPQEALNSAAKIKPSRQGGVISRCVGLCRSIWVPHHTSACLPHHQRSKPSTAELGVCAVTPGPIQGDHNFVLLCVPFMRWVAKLWQAEVCKINSDQDFFRVLRHYYNQHGKRPWARLRKVEAVRFVKFEVYSSQIVDVQNSPDVPNETQALGNYTFDPLPAETNPPIGPKLLAHFLEHPDHAEVLPVLYRKFPKKLRAKLQTCPQKGSAVGWGIEFVEGLNWFTVFLCGCGGFMAALVSAIVWSIARSDVQGGFAIAGFMLAFVGFCLGIARTEIQTV